MLRFISISSLVLLSLLLSCQPKKHEPQGPKQISLVAKEFQVEVLVTPGSMTIYNNFLIKRTDSSVDSVFRIFNLIDDSYCFSVLRRGRGPREVGNPAGVAVDERNETLWLEDWDKYCVHKISLGSLLTNPKYKPSYAFPLDESWIPTRSMFFHPSGNIGFSSFMLPDNLISVVDTKGGLMDSLSIPNTFLNDMYEDIGISEVPLWCQYVQEKDLMIVASHWENKFWIVEMDGTVLLQKEDIPKRTNEIYSGHSSSSFYSVSADESYIYFIYLGGEIIKFDEDAKHQLEYPNRLLVVDWKGTFHYDISLDKGIIFAVLDKERKRLICDSQDVDNFLVSYDLSWLYEE
jgi:hypothetical protein